MKKCQSTGVVLDGPHAGRQLTGLGRAAPANLVLLDAAWCYHEYVRVQPLRGVHQYAYRCRLGRGWWAPEACDDR